MRVFVTGASGFVGSAVVEELLQNGHEVVGLVRSDEAASRLPSSGILVLKGDVNDPEMLRQGTQQTDAVIHTAFNHDFTRFKENCEADRLVIETLGSLLAGTGKPLVVTSGIGLLTGDGPITEKDVPTAGSDVIPRAATDEGARTAAANGADVYIVRLPPSVHGRGDRGFVPVLADLARQHRESAFIGDGANYWPAVHRHDAAVLYRLIVEKRPALKTLHAVAEEGIPFRDIAETIAQGLAIPVASKTGDAIATYFGWFTHFAGMNCRASSKCTREQTGWNPVSVGLLEDIRKAGYLHN